MTSFTMTPPLRSAEQAARDFLAKYREEKCAADIMECRYDNLFVSPDLVARWNEHRAEASRCADAVEALGYVHLFDECEPERTNR